MGLLSERFRWLRERLPNSAALVVELAHRYRRLLTANLTAVVLAAVCEGGTMGLLALAMATLIGDTTAGGWSSLAGVATSAREFLGRDSLFLALVVLAVLQQLVRAALQWGSGLAVAALHARTEADLRQRLFERVLAMPFARANRYSLGDLSTYATQSASVGKVLQHANQLASQTLLAVACGVVLCWLSWSLTLVVLLAIVPLAFGMRAALRRIRSAGQESSQSSVSLAERMLEFFAGLRLVRSLAREEFAAGRHAEEIERHRAANQQMLAWQSAVTPLVESAALACVAMFLLGGYWLLGSSEPAVLARLASFVVVLYRILPRVSLASNAWAGIAHHAPQVERVAQFLAPEAPQHPARARQAAPHAWNEIVFQNVRFRYETRTEAALAGLSFRIRRGAHVALVGSSGSGKSTVADLLLALYEPSQGRILIDNVDLAEIDPGTWRERIGVVSQTPMAFSSSARENIAFGWPGAGTSEIEAAARAAGAHEFLAALPQGYETPLGERGSRLSGGQLQRLALARAILRSPDLLILDEATSSLDSRSEQAVQESLAELAEGRTVLSIAHRLSTIAGADLILVLEEGRLVEQGKHAELLARRGRYAELWRLQIAERPGRAA